MVSVTVKGARELAAALSDPDLLDRILRPGFRDAGLIVYRDAKANVHRVSGKLQNSLGDGPAIEGHGRTLRGRIGHAPGFDKDAGYQKSESSRWRRPRKGVNRGDPQVYAIYEERGTRYREGHPYLEPALMNNLGRIETAIQNAANAVLNSLRRR